jgi:trk system potassium uptake protein TrkH
MLPSLIVALLFGEGMPPPFSHGAAAAGHRTGAAQLPPSDRHLHTRDGLAIVGLGWLAISFFGALPFWFSGAIPGFVDAFFESVSGFTTTGASILTEIEDCGGHPVLAQLHPLDWRHGRAGADPGHSALGWRPRDAHSQGGKPGPAPEKLVPKIGQTAKILYAIYVGLTLLETALLMVAGMNLYDALIHAFGTAGTGGFSSRNLSVGAYGSGWIDGIITVFMLAFGVNFALYYQLLRKKAGSVARDGELRTYLLIVAVSMLLVAANLTGPVYGGFLESFRYAAFQVASIITTTGYATTDFNLWPAFSQMILLALMFVGASAGSTGGGIKVVRFLLMFKLLRRELVRLIHPRSVHVVRLGGKPVEEETLSGVLLFFFVYLMVGASAVFLVSLDGKDMLTTTTSVLATISNIGPGLGLVGPMGNYAAFSPLSKLVLSFCMVTGRLEVFPMLLLFVPSFWKRVNI